MHHLIRRDGTKVRQAPHFNPTKPLLILLVSLTLAFFFISRPSLPSPHTRCALYVKHCRIVHYRLRSFGVCVYMSRCVRYIHYIYILGKLPLLLSTLTLFTHTCMIFALISCLSPCASLTIEFLLQVSALLFLSQSFCFISSSPAI